MILFFKKHFWLIEVSLFKPRIFSAENIEFSLTVERTDIFNMFQYLIYAER